MQRNHVWLKRTNLSIAFEWPSDFGIRHVYFEKESGCLQGMVKKNKVKMAVATV